MITVTFFILILVLCLVLKTFGVNYDVLSLVFVGLSSLVIMLHILYSKDLKKYKGLLLLAFGIRFAFMLIDLYLFRLPHAGADDDGFYLASVRLFNGEFSITDTVYGEYYSKLLYLLYLFIGPNRFSAQFTNVIFAMMSIIYFIKILNKLELNDKSKNIGIAIFSFMPNVIFLNTILRRDTLITLLAIMSIKKMVDWYKDKKIENMILSFVYVFIASLIHSAMIFVLFAYLICIFMYDRKKEKIDFVGRNSYKLVFLIILLLVVGSYFFTDFDRRFQKFTDFDTLYETVSKSKGDSAYLTSMKIQNFYDLIIYSPFKFVYFLFSPMPWDFRGIVDMCTFVLDSSVYIYLTIIVVKNKKRGLIPQLLLWSFIFLNFVFAWGTFTSGTAIRHRYNVLPFLLVNACYLLNENDLNEKEINYNER